MKGSDIYATSNCILEALLTKDNPNESICTRIQKATDRMLAKIPTFNVSGTN